jgi:hypothetical protein
LEIGGSDLFFNPEDDVVACPVRIVAQIVIEAQMCNPSSLQQLYDLFRPATANPAFWNWSFVIEVDLQFCFPSRYQTNSTYNSSRL